MDRRAFLGTLAGGLLAAPLVAEAQPAGKVPRIGWVGNMAPPPPPVSQLEGFRQGLRELGYVEGLNLVIEYRWAAGKLNRLPDLVADLVRLKVDVLLVAGQQGLDAARRAGSGTPAVLVACDPLEALVGSLARPGGTATGLTCISSELASKRLELLKELVPRLSRVDIVYNPGDPNKLIEVRQLERAARPLGLAVRSVPIGEPDKFDAAFRGLTRDGRLAIVTLADPFMNFHRRQIVDLAAQYKLPAVYGFKEYVDAGGLLSYGASLSDAFRRAAAYVDKILKGAKPGDLPVEQPTQFELVINLKTAKALGLAIPPSLLQRADQVIE